MKKYLFMLAALLCCGLTSVMLCSCGDDDTSTTTKPDGGSSSKAAYWTLTITRSLKNNAQAQTDQNGYITVTATHDGTSQPVVNDQAVTIKSTNLGALDSVVVMETVSGAEFTGEKMKTGAFYSYSVVSYDASGKKIAASGDT